MIIFWIFNGFKYNYIHILDEMNNTETFKLLLYLFGSIILIKSKFLILQNSTEDLITLALIPIISFTYISFNFIFNFCQFLEKDNFKTIKFLPLILITSFGTFLFYLNIIMFLYTTNYTYLFLTTFYLLISFNIFHIFKKYRKEIIISNILFISSIYLYFICYILF